MTDTSVGHLIPDATKSGETLSITMQIVCGRIIGGNTVVLTLVIPRGVWPDPLRFFAIAFEPLKILSWDQNVFQAEVILHVGQLMPFLNLIPCDRKWN